MGSASGVGQTCSLCGLHPISCGPCRTGRLLESSPLSRCAAPAAGFRFRLPALDSAQGFSGTLWGLWGLCGLPGFWGFESWLVAAEQTSVVPRIWPFCLSGICLCESIFLKTWFCSCLQLMPRLHCPLGPVHLSFTVTACCLGNPYWPLCLPPCSLLPSAGIFPHVASRVSFRSAPR